MIGSLSVCEPVFSRKLFAYALALQCRRRETRQCAFWCALFVDFVFMSGRASVFEWSTVWLTHNVAHSDFQRTSATAGGRFAPSVFFELLLVAVVVWLVASRATDSAMPCGNCRDEVSVKYVGVVADNAECCAQSHVGTGCVRECMRAASRCWTLAVGANVQVPSATTPDQIEPTVVVVVVVTIGDLCNYQGRANGFSHQRSSGTHVLGHGVFCSGHSYHRRCHPRACQPVGGAPASSCCCCVYAPIHMECM